MSNDDSSFSSSSISVDEYHDNNCAEVIASNNNIDDDDIYNVTTCSSSSDKSDADDSHNHGNGRRLNRHGRNCSRRTKRQRRHAPPQSHFSSSDDDANSDSDEYEDISQGEDSDNEDVDDEVDDDTVNNNTVMDMDRDQDEEIAFCCRKCKCENKDTNVIFSGDDSVAHRFCCHNIGKPHPKEWKSPFDRAMLKKEQILLNPNSRNNNYTDDTKPKKYYKRRELRKFLKSAKMKEIEYDNAFGDVAPDQLSYTSTKYLTYCQEYEKIRKQYTLQPQQPKHQAVVLDIFSGIGAGLVTLKRLGIAIEKVIHIEIDPVCTHVFRHNHDCTYNTDLQDDGITYIYDAYPRFEDIEANVQTFVETYGPIDIIIGGPPCQDYTPVNAFREGVQGHQGKYLPNFGKFIQNVQRKQRQAEEENQDNDEDDDDEEDEDEVTTNPLFFLAENVEIKKLDDIEVIQESFGYPGFLVDAQDFSPCRRKRHFFCNFPVSSVSTDDKIFPSSCLEEGWSMPTDCFDSNHDLDDNDGVNEENWRKANTFMASLSRKDDIPRMLRVRAIMNDKGKTRYEEGTFTVEEREKMLGFPKGYVIDAMETLHKELREVLFVVSKDQIQTEDYTKFSNKYEAFSGGNFRFKVKGYDIEILIGEPQESKKAVSYFDKEGYAKHVLGNTFSIPVVEHLLSPLTAVFKEKNYDGFDYDYEWQNEP